MITLFAAIWMPCKGVEDGSWTWWLKWCWVTDSAIVALLVGVTLAALVAAQVWAASRQPKVAV